MKSIFTLLLIVLLSPTYAEVKSYTEQQKMKQIDFAQKTFRKKLQRKCGFTGGHFAQQHTKQEWNSMKENKAFKTNLETMCPRAVGTIEDKWIEPLHLFAIEYAKDAAKRPRC